MPRDLVLVRHGESEGNLALRMARAGDPNAHAIVSGKSSARWRLTDRGILQAQITGEWLRGEFPNGFDRWYSSEYTRARETAGHLGFDHARWYLDHMLRERDWGQFDRMSLEERERDHAELLAFQDEEPLYWSPLGGESIADVTGRFNRVLSSMHREVSEGSGIIVCHGEVMWTARYMLERMTQERFKELHLSRAAHDRINNCQILHYTRIDPATGIEGPYYDHMRSLCPSHPDPELRAGEWTRIKRPVFSSQEMLDGVEQYPRLINEPCSDALT